MSGAIILETSRLVLRELTPDNAETLYGIYHTPNVWTYFSKGPPDSIETERAGIVRHLDHYQRHGFGLWGGGAPRERRLDRPLRVDSANGRRRA